MRTGSEVSVLACSAQIDPARPVFRIAQWLYWPISYDPTRHTVKPPWNNNIEQLFMHTIKLKIINFLLQWHNYNIGHEAFIP